MDISEFAKEYKRNGIHIILNDDAIEFAKQWAAVSHALYLLEIGIIQVEQAKRMLGIKPDAN